MKPDQALEIIKTALEPENSGRISLKGYATIFQAIQVLEGVVMPLKEKEEGQSVEEKV